MKFNLPPPQTPFLNQDGTVNRSWYLFLSYLMDRTGGLEGLPAAEIYVGNASNEPEAQAVSGDITITAAGVTTIGNDKVTFAKMQNIATDSLIGRDTASTGDPENILLNATLSMDGSGNLQRAALTGDVTASAGSNATTLVATSNVVEIIQDNIGTILVDSSSVDFTYSDATPSITAVVLPAGVDHGGLAGLGDDDHALYLLASDATNRATFASNWTDLTDGGTTTLHTHTSGVASSITVANEATDTSCFPVFVTAATGDLGPKSNAGLAFNSNTGMLTATGFTGPLTGNASTATALQTPRTIGGTSFDGTANIVPATITVADTTDASCSVALFESATGDLGPKTDGGITYNASNGTLTATAFSGPLTGNVTGDVSGNAGTATALETARTIGGTSFDGTANIVPSTITVANEATDTSCFIAFVTAATGDLQPKSNANLTFNSNTGVLTSASLVATTADINGGTVDGATIGGSSAAAGTFTSVTAGTSITLTKSDSGAVVNSLIANTSNTADSSARQHLQVAGASAGDPLVIYDISGVLGWAHGVDNSDSDKFKICASTVLGTNDFLVIDTAGDMVFGGSITTRAPTGGAGAWELGIANAVSPTSPNRTLTVEIGGTTYYIHAKTTND